MSPSSYRSAAHVTDGRTDRQTNTWWQKINSVAHTRKIDNTSRSSITCWALVMFVTQRQKICWPWHQMHCIACVARGAVWTLPAYWLHLIAAAHRNAPRRRRFVRTSVLFWGICCGKNNANVICGAEGLRAARHRNTAQPVWTVPANSMCLLQHSDTQRIRWYWTNQQLLITSKMNALHACAWHVKILSKKSLKIHNVLHYFVAGMILWSILLI